MVAARPHHTPSELAEAAAKAVVTARGYEHSEGELYLDAFGWALGGQVEYATGLGLFATAVLDVAAAADSPGESTAPTDVYVVQAEDGDVVDVTTSLEWAEHLTRDDEDTPIRTLHKDTLWDGPEDRSEW